MRPVCGGDGPGIHGILHPATQADAQDGRQPSDAATGSTAAEGLGQVTASNPDDNATTFHTGKIAPYKELIGDMPTWAIQKHATLTFSAPGKADLIASGAAAGMP